MAGDSRPVTFALPERADCLVQWSRAGKRDLTRKITLPETLPETGFEIILKD
jgi:hypothetical protein